MTEKYQARDFQKWTNVCVWWCCCSDGSRQWDWMCIVWWAGQWRLSLTGRGCSLRSSAETSEYSWSPFPIPGITAKFQKTNWIIKSKWRRSTQSQAIQLNISIAKRRIKTSFNRKNVWMSHLNEFRHEFRTENRDSPMWISIISSYLNGNAIATRSTLVFGLIVSFDCVCVHTCHHTRPIHTLPSIHTSTNQSHTRAKSHPHPHNEPSRMTNSQVDCLEWCARRSFSVEIFQFTRNGLANVYFFQLDWIA